MTTQTAKDTEKISVARDAIIPINRITPSSSNPRKTFDQTALDELAESIRRHGLLSPIAVRPDPETVNTYTVIAGERRWKACAIAGLKNVPCRVYDIDEHTALEIQMVENLIRENLDPIETARGYQQLIETAGMTQGEIGEALGKPQASIAHALRLLALPEDVLTMIADGRLSVAHGKALVRFAQWPKLCSRIAAVAVSEGWTSKRLEGQVGVYSGIYDSSFKSKKLVVDVDPQIDRKELKAAGITVWGDYAPITPDVDKYPEVAKRLKAEKSAAVRQAQKDLGETVKAGEKPQHPIELTNINADHYVDLRMRGTPEDCTGDCPCRMKAKNEYGHEIEICADPVRWKGLLEAQQTAKQTAKQVRYLAVLAPVEEAIEKFDTNSSRAMALLVKRVFRGNQEELRAAWKRFVPTFIPEPNWEAIHAYAYDPSIEALDALAAAPADSLLRIALDLELRNELRDYLVYDYSWKQVTVTLWLTGLEIERSGEIEASTDSVMPCDNEPAPAAVEA
jgi:ParB/RepB/Spo0J family partition protein